MKVLFYIGFNLVYINTVILIWKIKKSPTSLFMLTLLLKILLTFTSCDVNVEEASLVETENVEKSPKLVPSGKNGSGDTNEHLFIGVISFALVIVVFFLLNENYLDQVAIEVAKELTFSMQRKEVHSVEKVNKLVQTDASGKVNMSTQTGALEKTDASVQADFSEVFD